MTKILVVKSTGPETVNHSDRVNEQIGKWWKASSASSIGFVAEGLVPVGPTDSVKLPVLTLITTVVLEKK